MTTQPASPSGEPPLPVGAVITIRDIYDLALETKLTVGMMNEQIKNVVDDVKEHNGTLAQHEAKINDLYKKWYTIAGLGGVAGGLITLVLQIFVTWLQSGAG